MHCDSPKGISFASIQNAELGLAMRRAFSSIAWNTGSSSPGELLMTCSTSDVAVCCSSALEFVGALRSSLSSRAFSMAITA